MHVSRLRKGILEVRKQDEHLKMRPLVIVLPQPKAA